MSYSFKDCISPIENSVVKITVDSDYQKKIADFVTDLIQHKASEKQHKVDNNKEFKRFFTGYLGEAALEKLFGIKIIDWTIGDSAIYHVPDIPGYSTGIKTVEYGKFPVIFKNNFYSQIICVTGPETKGLVYICGLATKEVLNKYQDIDLILDPNLRKRGTKTGFYGFDHLLPVRSIEDIADFKK